MASGLVGQPVAHHLASHAHLRGDQRDVHVDRRKAGEPVDQLFAKQGAVRGHVDQAVRVLFAHEREEPRKSGLASGSKKPFDSRGNPLPSRR